MPNIKSAIKRVKVTSTKNLRNRKIRSEIATTAKKLSQAASANDQAAAADLHKKSVSLYDKAVTKGVLHKNTANRKKAKMARIASSIS